MQSSLLGVIKRLPSLISMWMAISKHSSAWILTSLIGIQCHFIQCFHINRKKTEDALEHCINSRKYVLSDLVSIPKYSTLMSERARASFWWANIHKSRSRFLSNDWTQESNCHVMLPEVAGWMRISCACIFCKK